jgi:hypothetical protein
MRINVVGKSEAATEVRGLLKSQDFLITEERPHFTLLLEEDPALEGKDFFVVDGVRGWMETRVSEHIHLLSKKNIHLARQGGVQTDRALRIVYAPQDASVVATGAFRGLLDTCRAPKRTHWWQKLTRRLHG